MRVILLALSFLVISGCSVIDTIFTTRVEHVVPPKTLVTPVRYPEIHTDEAGVTKNIDILNYLIELEIELAKSELSYKAYHDWITRHTPTEDKEDSDE